jgi:hypothetical protein
MMLYDAGVKESEAALAVSALAKERPDWLPVLEAALIVAERAERYGGEFAGAWVIDELEERTGHPTWLPNLRLLTSYGLLEKVGESTRGGRRAYYRCSQREAISRVLSQLMPKQSQSPPPADAAPAKFRFIGAGDSRQPGSDVARRAGEITYQPRSWR